MHEMGLDAYIFSIAWPRLIADGGGKINPKGLEYYNNIIDELILRGMTVRVRNISDLVTEREVREFFSFSGQIKHVESDSIQWRRGGLPMSHSKIPRLSRLRFTCQYGYKL
ncbi:uncharacterized protein [Miscanthus floridulus]|uniref:uncharacterized protein isoform X1 n=1 Tax=Miscanthus floridulus TaxID=154761 RepID=UPI003459A476